MVKKRDTRYQGAVVRDDRILLIKHREKEGGRSYWILPGGGREPGETEEECIRREMKEETNLTANVVRILLSEPDPFRTTYQTRKTYLCEPDSGKAEPGSEPEPDAASLYTISEVKWFDLRDDSEWDADLVADSITNGQLYRLRRSMGYLPKEA
jgi:ADP-ribose pyrophosphatase YjhB (NUDIX family)